MIGNLNDFDVEKDAICYEDLHPFDRYLLHTVSKLDGSLRESYDTYSFISVTQTLLNFINSDLSSFYFEVCKDRLYLSEVDGASRRGVQTVFHHTLELINLAIAPITCHLAEEVHHFRRGVDPSRSKGCGSLFENGPLWTNQFEAFAMDEDLVSKWEVVRSLRKKVFQDIQAAKETSAVSSSLDSDVDIICGEDVLPVVKEIDDMGMYEDDSSLLNAALLTSQVSLHGVSGDREIVGRDSMKISVRATEKHKCPRCWRCVSDSKETICTRCERVIAKDHPSLVFEPPAL
eukprot:m.177513 g.177513  ORF g.177513 m.177513 type:complete len:289 (+) comp13549_c0_seq3:135-1001(+)